MMFDLLFFIDYYGAFVRVFVGVDVIRVYYIYAYEETRYTMGRKAWEAVRYRIEYEPICVPRVSLDVFFIGVGLIACDYELR